MRIHSNDWFTVVEATASECDIYELLENDENAKIIKVIQKAFNENLRKNTKTYMITFETFNKVPMLILEQTFMKTLYHEYRISLEPWIKFKGHVIVPVSAFMKNVEKEHLEMLFAEQKGN